jgi:hypothetical protein
LKFVLRFSFSLSPDHGLIQQIKLTLNDIYSILPKIITNSSPWIIASPSVFVKKQLKRTISLPLIGGTRNQCYSSPCGIRYCPETVSKA